MLYLLYVPVLINFSVYKNVHLSLVLQTRGEVVGTVEIANPPSFAKCHHLD